MSSFEAMSACYGVAGTAALSVASREKPAARAMCCGSGRTFASRWRAGSRSPVPRRSPALLSDTCRWEVRSAGAGSKGQRWYAWAWLATTSPRHCLLIRRHPATGEPAFHYCYTPGGQRVSKARLIRAAGLRWPVEENFESGKDCFGAGKLTWMCRPPSGRAWVVRVARWA
jgi:hypothetical protein